MIEHIQAETPTSARRYSVASSAQRSSGSRSIGFRHVNVHGRVGIRQSHNLGPPAVHFTAGLHRDDRLGHPAPPGGRLPDGLPQAVLATVSYDVRSPSRQHRGPDNDLC